MIEKARVISVDGHKAKVYLIRHGACGDKCGGCSGGCATTGTYVEAINDIGAEAGQEVEIEMKTQVFMNAILLNYGLPLIMLIIGMFAGIIIKNLFNLSLSSDLLSVLLGFGLMALSYLVVNRIDKHYKKTDKVKMNIISIV